MNKISFIILHYMAIEDTIECVESILKFSYSDKYELSIIIVDNASPDDSYGVLKEKYENNEYIILIKNEKNLGFAKGNNIGYQFAKNNLKSDYIILINNDTYIKQMDFCEKLILDYQNTKFDIAGPNIISLKSDNVNQNPMKYEPMTIERINKIIFRYKVQRIACYFNCDKFVNKIRRKHKNEKESNEKKDYKLHGSCLIFSKNYIDKYDGLYPNTFMYAEEDILKYISIRDNLKMIFLDNLTIYHKEDASTDVVFNKAKKKRLFYYRWSIDSLMKLKKLMISDKGKENT